ncbi:hypothetical protein [Reichenbachiella sp. MALMAid0571]|uniref:hypothetical protein n=1 Tax=Reichenbachiella sp. MALMAid0571 TaxID=3143939 RepID=UPI0032DF94DF
MNKSAIVLIIATFLLFSCENREVNPEKGPNFSEIHENMEYHFDKIKIDGYDYLILERDRNNPHEGFGFMALNGTRFGSNQDTIKAYLKTVLKVQAELMAKLNEETTEESASKIDEILNSNLSQIKTYARKDSTKRKSKN